MVKMGDVCEMRDGSPSSTKIRDACMYYGYEAGTLVYMQELQQESWLEKKEKETWPLVSSTDKKTESESLGGQGLSKCGVFISLLTL